MLKKLKTFEKVRANSKSPHIFVTAIYCDPFIFVSDIFDPPNESDYILVNATRKFWELIE